MRGCYHSRKECLLHAYCSSCRMMRKHAMPGFSVTLLLLIAFGLLFAQQQPEKPDATPTATPQQNQSQAQPATPLHTPAPGNTSASPVDLQEQAWEVLQTGANSEKTGDRVFAIHALGLITNDKRAWQMVEAALQDDAAQVRTTAAAALGDMHAQESIPKLQSATGDKDPSVALAAAHALLQLHDPSGYDVYYEILTGERKTGKGVLGEVDVLKDRKKLAEMGFREGIGFIPFAGYGWDAYKMIAKNDASPVRAAAATVLAKDPDPQTTRALVNATGDKNWIIRAAALEALAKRGDPSVLGTVQLYLTDQEGGTKYAAAATVLQLSAAHPTKTAGRRRLPKRK